LLLFSQKLRFAPAKMERSAFLFILCSPKGKFASKMERKCAKTLDFFVFF